jgi:ABC-type thiamine transport system substrate-binding protein
MDTFTIEKFALLSAAQQELVLQFIDFLYQQSVAKPLQEVDSSFPISDSLREYLDKRLMELEQKPEKHFSIEEMETYFMQKRQKLDQNV